MNNTLKTNESLAIIIKISELGTASHLTQGAEKGWFEYGRPSHPKDFKHPYIISNGINNYILNQKKDV